MIWSVSDKLKSKINRITGKNATPAPSYFTQEEGVGNRTLADAGPYGIGFAASDRLWQAEEARLDLAVEERRSQRRRYVLGGLLLLSLLGALGSAWSGSEPVPVVPDAPASLMIDPPVADPLVALVDSAADGPAPEALGSTPMLAAAPPDAFLTVVHPGAVAKAHLPQPQVKPALPIHHASTKAPNTHQNLAANPSPRVSALVTKGKAVERIAPAPVEKAEALKHQPQTSPQMVATETPSSSTTHQQMSLVRIVRPSADIGSKAGQPDQAGSRSSAFAPAAPAQPSSNRTAQASSAQSPSTPYNPKPIYPPADIRDTPPSAAPPKPAQQGLKKPSLVDAMFPRLYLLSEALK